jgi:hypothetical protein
VEQVLLLEQQTQVAVAVVHLALVAVELTADQVLSLFDT